MCTPVFIVRESQDMETIKRPSADEWRRKALYVTQWNASPWFKNVVKSNDFQPHGQTFRISC